MSSFTFMLGQEVQDKLTGFKGIVMGRSDFLTGCNRYGVAARGTAKMDEKAREWRWFDEAFLQTTGKVFYLEDRPKRNTGGPAVASHDPSPR